MDPQKVTLNMFKLPPKLIFIPKYVDLFTCRKNRAYLCMSHLASFLSLTPPSPQCNLVLFFGHKKSFARMTEENFDDYNDGCKDNYDNNYGDIIIW